MALTLIAAAAVGLVGFVPTVLVGQALPGTPATPDVPGTTVAKFADGEIRYQDEGAGDEAIVLLHGFNGHLGQWDAVWRGLEGCDCRRVRLDLPGFGGSAWARGGYGVEAQVSRVVALLDRLGIERATLAGTSMGGSIATALAATHPERVRRLVLIAPSGYPGSLVQSGLFGVLARPGLPNDVASIVTHNPLFGLLYPHSRARQALDVTATYGASWRALLERVRVPTVVVWGRADETTPYRFAAPVADAIPGSRLISVDGGHLVPEQHPAVVVSVLTDSPNAAA
jgi:pimeloyl-ACP methyl ester carboxylesterase